MIIGASWRNQTLLILQKQRYRIYSCFWLANEMQNFRYKTHGAVGTDTRQHGSLTQLLFDIPALSFALRLWKTIPPRHVLNEILRNGVSEAGMSGGCVWQPFEIKEAEYAELLEDLLTLPNTDLHIDVELENSSNLKDWQFQLMRKHRKNNEVRK